jgi:hypothetical protein
MYTASLNHRRDNEPLLVDASNILKPSSSHMKEEALKDNVVYEKIKNICCIGAGYVVSINLYLLLSMKLC